MTSRMKKLIKPWYLQKQGPKRPPQPIPTRKALPQPSKRPLR